MKNWVDGWVALVLVFASSLNGRAQAVEAELIPPALVPASGTFFLVQQADWPPLPFAPPDLPVYGLGDGLFLVDDSAVDYPAPASLNDAGPLESGQFMYGESFNNGCGLWLEIADATNKVLLTLHNTRTGQTYTVWSIQNLSLTNWIVETNLTGASGDLTLTLIPMGGRSNLFLRASELRNYATNVVFLGLSYSNTVANRPDTMGAVGPDHFVELLNKRIAVYDKSGVLITQTNSADFFRRATNQPAGDMLDPRILFDHESQRWVATALDSTSLQVFLAVSTSAVPTNLATGWYRWMLPVHGSLPFTDFPTLGLDANGLYVAALQSASTTNAGHTVVAIKKPEIYQGTQPITTRFDLPADPPVVTIQPAVNFDPVPTNGYAWFVAKGPPVLGTNYQGGSIFYRRLQWSNTIAVLDTNWLEVADIPAAYRDYYDLDGTNVSVLATHDDGVTAPQATAEGGTNINLHAVGSRLAATVIRNGFLWTCQAVGLSGTNGTYAGNETGTNVDRAGAQWLRLCVDADNGQLAYNTHGRVYDATATTNAHYYYFPSLMVNCAGDMVMGFSGSSATNYIGAYYTWRLSSGATLEKPKVIQDGSIAFSNRQWGDYSATTLDPVDDWSFWTVQQYADPEGANEFGEMPWRTVIAKLRPIP